MNCVQSNAKITLVLNTNLVLADLKTLHQTKLLWNTKNSLGSMSPDLNSAGQFNVFLDGFSVDGIV